MSEVTLASASQKQVWITDYFKEYVRASRFLPYMGKTNNSIIIAKYELQTEAGKTINIPLITRLKSAGVTGSSPLDGFEEELGNYNCPISVDWRRNGVRLPKSTTYQTEMDLWNAAKAMLKTWESEQVRNDIIKALCSAVTDSAGTTVNWDAATAANKNTWVAANSDRVLFGSLLSNYSATFATAAGNVASTAKACAANMSLAKRIAKLANPHIRPQQSEDGSEYYVAFHGSRSFRDIKADATIVLANKDARPREGTGMDRNPLFQDGDVIYDGVIHREVPEIDDYAVTAGFNAIGASSADIRPVFVCGQQSVGIAWGQEPTPRQDMLKDYQFRPGVAIEELLGVKKLNFNSVQQGIVTVFVGAAADS